MTEDTRYPYNADYKQALGILNDSDKPASASECEDAIAFEARLVGVSTTAGFVCLASPEPMLPEVGAGAILGSSGSIVCSSGTVALIVVTLRLPAGQAQAGQRLKCCTQIVTCLLSRRLAVAKVRRPTFSIPFRVYCLPSKVDLETVSVHTIYRRDKTER